MIWLAMLLPICNYAAQIQIGTVGIKLTDSSGAVVQGATASLTNRLTGYRRSILTDKNGYAVFNNVPFNDYQLSIEATSFQPAVKSVSVTSNLPVEINLQLAVRGAAETVEVQADSGLLQRTSASTKVTLDETSIGRAPGTSRSVQQIISTLPGWASENDGLLHIRGVDDGVLFVIDGVPIADRSDRTSASGFDDQMINSMTVLTGNLPAEFGGKSGAVVTIQPESRIGLPFTGRFGVGASSFTGKEVSAAGGMGRENYGFFAGLSAHSSNRFLDPVDQQNFHNSGGLARLNGRFDWHPSPNGILIVNASVNGSDFDVTNTHEQELAGQNQRQHLRDNTQSLSWQRTWSAHTVSDFAVFHAFRRADLNGSAFDTPLFAQQERHHRRLGLLASLTHEYRGHTFKGGIELSRVTPTEFFIFAVTDEDAARRSRHHR